jgi:uncharacterized MAPEG superfamily protein
MTIAYWCVLVGIFLPYIWFGVANAKGKGLRNNHYPRDFAQAAEGVAKRAFGAHLNAFEALPAFAAAVIIAELAKHATQNCIDGLALAWVGLRILHGVFYVMDRGGPRSLVWFGGVICVVSLFALSA